jgi:hypothetical protein
VPPGGSRRGRPVPGVRGGEAEPSLLVVAELTQAQGHNGGEGSGLCGRGFQPRRGGCSGRAPIFAAPTPCWRGSSTTGRPSIPGRGWPSCRRWICTVPCCSRSPASSFPWQRPAGPWPASSQLAALSLYSVGAALLTPGSLAILAASFVYDDRARAIRALAIRPWCVVAEDRARRSVICPMGAGQ